MKKKAQETVGRQEVPQAKSIALKQLALPLVVASSAIMKGLHAFVHQVGLLMFTEMLGAAAEEIAGPKGKRAKERLHHHWGTASTPLPFGGRQVLVQRPRARRRGKGCGEAELPSIAAARAADPMPAHVTQQVVVGVSTRGYRRSLEPIDESHATRRQQEPRRAVHPPQPGLAGRATPANPTASRARRPRPAAPGHAWRAIAPRRAA